MARCLLIPTRTLFSIHVILIPSDREGVSLTAFIPTPSPPLYTCPYLAPVRTTYYYRVMISFLSPSTSIWYIEPLPSPHYLLYTTLPIHLSLTISAWVPYHCPLLSFHFPPLPGSHLAVISPLRASRMKEGAASGLLDLEELFRMFGDCLGRNWP